MRLAIMQPYIFPYIGYYQLISAVDKFVFYDDVNFITRGWVNRNNILINGKASLFSIPLKNASQNRLINEIELVAEPGWRNKFLKTTEHAYKKAPYFQEVFSLISNIIESEQIQHVNELANLSIRSVCDYLGVNTSFVQTSAPYNNKALKGQNRILDICKIENAEQYINPIGGIEIYSRELFESSGIKINFIKTADVKYVQFTDEFVPNLSIIDVLMFNGVEEIRRMLTQYQLV